MRREDITELYFITPINNIPSILKLGLLSHERAKAIPHESIAMDEIQDRREHVLVPGGRPLHQYANLYFSARNPMMFKRKENHRSNCVLRFLPSVLDLQNVIVVDQNASSIHARFLPVPAGIEYLDRELIFARDWRHPDQREFWRRRSAKCAEVLVPDMVDSSYIAGFYVSCQEASEKLKSMAQGLPIAIDPDLFFA